MASRFRPASAGRYTVYATNHGGRESVEVFDLSIGTVGRDPIVAPGSGACYCRQSSPPTASPRFSDGTLVATVLDSAGQDVPGCLCRAEHRHRAAVDAGHSALRCVEGHRARRQQRHRDIADDREFYVASHHDDARLRVFARQPGGGPVRFAQLKDFGPDNVRLNCGIA
jgi:hypothetical protein